MSKGRPGVAGRTKSRQAVGRRVGVDPPQPKCGLGLLASRPRRTRAKGRGGHMTDGSAIRFEPKTAEMLRVLAAAYTKF